MQIGGLHILFAAVASSIYYHKPPSNDISFRALSLPLEVDVVEFLD